MPGSAAKVVLSERQHAILRSFSTSRTAPVRLAQRATLLLLANALKALRNWKTIT